MQRSGTEAIRSQIQPSKPKREIDNTTNSQNTKGTYGQPKEQLFPKRWPLSNRNRTNCRQTHLMCVPIILTNLWHQKIGNREPQQKYRLGTVSNELLGGGGKLVLRAQPHPQFLKWYMTFSWLFGLHDYPLSRQ